MFCSYLNLYFNLYDPLYFLTVSCTSTLYAISYYSGDTSALIYY